MGFIHVALLGFFGFLYYSAYNYIIASRKKELISQALFNYLDVNDNRNLQNSDLSNFQGFLGCSDEDSDKLLSYVQKSLGKKKKNLKSFSEGIKVDQVQKIVKDCFSELQDFSNKKAFKKMTQPQQVEKIIKNFDLNQDDSVSFDQFNSVFAMAGRDSKKEQSLFKELDKNGDWQVSLSEKKKKVKSH